MQQLAVMGCVAGRHLGDTQQVMVSRQNSAGTGYTQQAWGVYINSSRLHSTGTQQVCSVFSTQQICRV